MAREYKPKHTDLDALNDKLYDIHRGRNRRALAGLTATIVLSAPGVAFGDSINRSRDADSLQFDTNISDTFVIPEAVPGSGVEADTDNDEQTEQLAPEQDPIGLMNQISEASTSQPRPDSVPHEEEQVSDDADSQDSKAEDGSTGEAKSSYVVDIKSNQDAETADEAESSSESVVDYTVKIPKSTADEEMQIKQSKSKPDAETKEDAAEQPAEVKADKPEASKDDQDAVDAEPEDTPEASHEQTGSDNDQDQKSDDKEAEPEETDPEDDILDFAVASVDEGTKDPEKPNHEAETEQPAEAEDAPAEDADSSDDLFDFAVTSIDDATPEAEESNSEEPETEQPAEVEEESEESSEPAEETDPADDLFNFALTEDQVEPKDDPEAEKPAEEADPSDSLLDFAVPNSEPAPADDSEKPATPSQDPETPESPEPDSAEQEPPKKSVSEIADEVIAGKWGKDQERIDNLTKAGYNHEEVQAEVNKRFSSGESIRDQTVTEQEARDLCAQAGVEYAGPEQGWDNGQPYPIQLCLLPDSITHDYDSNNPRYVNVLIVNQLVAALNQIRDEGIEVEINSAFRSADRQRELRQINGCDGDYNSVDTNNDGDNGCAIQIGGVGYSNHNKAGAVDTEIKENGVRNYHGRAQEIFNDHGFTNTVKNDAIHFEYTGPLVDVTYIIENGYAKAA